MAKTCTAARVTFSPSPKRGRGTLYRADLCTIIFAWALSATSGCTEPASQPTGESPGSTIKYLTVDGLVEASYELIDGLVVVEGDISLGTPEEAWAEDAALAAQYGVPDGGPHAAAPKALFDVRKDRRWTGGYIYYSIDGSFTRDDRTKIVAAVDAWNRRRRDTGLYWTESVVSQPNNPGVLFRNRPNSDKCNSDIGRHKKRNTINLGRTCVDPVVIAHEMGHSMGLGHEHQRFDRGAFIDVWRDNGRPSVMSDISEIPPRGSVPFASFVTVGNYDTESLMHYASEDFGNTRLPPISLPVLMNRHTLAIYRVASPGIYAEPTIEFRESSANSAVRLGGTGLNMDSVRVVDVDADGGDDLLTSASDGMLYWSVGARSGWRLVSSGGTPVDGPAHNVEFGELDGHPGVDAIRVNGKEWTLYSSSGDVFHALRNVAATDMHVADVDGDAIDDVFVVLSDGRWQYARGPDVMGDMYVRTTASMGVGRVRLVSLTGAGLDVVAFKDGHLVFCRAGSDAFETLPGGVGLSSVISSLNDVWFYHLNRPETPGESIDLISWETGFEGSGAAHGTPIYVPDAAVQSVRPQMFSYSTSNAANGQYWEAGVDLKSFLTNLNFQGRLTKKMVERRALPGMWSLPGGSPSFGFVSHGWIQRHEPMPAESDVRALGIYYGHETGVFLSDRYPLAGSRNVFDVYSADCNPGERFELEADFMSAADPLSGAEIVVQRSGYSGLVDLSASQMALGGRQVGGVRTSFECATSGEFHVVVRPDNAAPPTPGRVHEARWIFHVAGDTCGDGFVDSVEECDDGNRTSGDGCEANCRLPSAYCGDGIVNAPGELCDDGNSVPNDGCTNCLIDIN